jgi:uncharacterized OB-fold protein
MSMQEFFDHLKKGEFKIPMCTLCKSAVWPPSHNCPRCLSKAPMKTVAKTGTLLEFANSLVPGKEGVFGLVKMSCGIKLVGSFDHQNLREGAQVTMDKCGLANGTAFYHFVPAKSEP